MKKLLSLVLILMSLSVLINCSPKTAKKTAGSKTPPANTNTDQPAVTPQISQQVAIDMEPPITEPIDPNSKTLPRITEMGIDQQLAMYKDMAPLRLEMGRKIYTQNCNKCHQFYPPESQSAPKWLNIMQTMGPRAKLDNDQYMMVAAYLVNNSKP